MVFDNFSKMSMISDKLCSTKLSLCSGNNSDDKTDDPKNKTSESFNLDHDLDQLLIPSLTLGISIFPAIKKLNHGVKSEEDYSNNLQKQGSNSSFSINGGSSSVKRKRRDDVCSFEEIVEVDKDITTKFEEDGQPKKKLRLTKDQSLLLEQSFMEHNTLYPKEKQALADILNLKPRQVEVWFQNRRARTKLKQTEIDGEILKKCCESLKEENTRLLKELQDLKSSIFYMHLPAVATLNICSSCQPFGGAANDASGENPSNISFSMGTPRTHFHRPNVNPFAACW